MIKLRARKGRLSWVGTHLGGSNAITRVLNKGRPEGQSQRIKCDPEAEVRAMQGHKPRNR